MSTAVFGAPEFRARSGRTVTSRADGSVVFDHVNGYLGPEQVFDAEEYFQARRDREIGRWRWPENPDYVVYRRADGLLALNEQSGNTKFQDLKVNRAARPGASILDQAIAAYFDAHPERKPWEDAQYGEVWAVTEASGQELYRVTHDGLFEQVSGSDGRLSMPIAHWSIVDGFRVWPEDAS